MTSSGHRYYGYVETSRRLEEPPQRFRWESNGPRPVNVSESGAQAQGDSRKSATRNHFFLDVGWSLVVNIAVLSPGINIQSESRGLSGIGW
jgi:hypothetical protein